MCLRGKRNALLEAPRFLSFLRVGTLLAFLNGAWGADCGGYIAVGASTTGTINSPNYPNAYPDYARCIWLFEASAEYQISLSIDFVGESYDGSCVDYIEVRDGSSSSTLHILSCGTLSGYTVTASARWLWVFFTSDGNSTTSGLSASYSAVYAGSVINNISSPITACRSYEFRCSNFECLSVSYRCDGYYDCGCNSGCDEDGCGGISLNTIERICLAAGCGIILFIIVCMGTYLIEERLKWYHKKRAEEAKKNTPQDLPWARRKGT